MGASDPFPAFYAALEARHRSELTFQEIRRALQALSSLYVERRERLGGGTALDGAGKRAAFALYCSPIPFPKAVGAVRIGHIAGEFVVNPSMKVMDQSRLNLIVAGTKEAICMVEAGATELTEEEMIQALELAHEQIKRICAAEEEVGRLEVKIETGTVRHGAPEYGREYDRCMSKDHRNDKTEKDGMQERVIQIDNSITQRLA